MPIHLVLGVTILVALGVLVVLAVRTIPAGEESGAASRRAGAPPEDGIGQRGTIAQVVTSDDSRPTERASQSPADPTIPPAPAAAQVARYRYKVIKVYPHDRRFFIQGLVYEDGLLYEGTGLYGQSALYKRDLQTGRIEKMLRLGDRYFGEGIALFGDRLIQLTWQAGVGFVYRKDTFTPLQEFKYRGEGWGLACDGRRLILSDGTATLRFLDPNTFAETGRLEVRDESGPIPNLNELEYVGPPPAGVAGSPAGPQIYANVWGTDRIAIIDPQTGRVTGWIDLSGLWTPPPEERDEAVLNGIAYLPETRHLLVTGKLWPRLYEIELVPQP